MSAFQSFDLPVRNFEVLTISKYQRKKSNPPCLSSLSAVTTSRHLAGPIGRGSVLVDKPLGRSWAAPVKRHPRIRPIKLNEDVGGAGSQGPSSRIGG